MSGVRIRMYRQGLGDCFLISLPRENGDAYFILIDCGVVLGTGDATTQMRRVVSDILETTGARIDLLIVTHEHWDHVSGFLQARELFARLCVNEIWLAWTEDPSDDLAIELRGERKALHRMLVAAAEHKRFKGCPDSELDSLLEFFGAAGQGTTADALNIARSLCPGNLRYCVPGQPPFTPEGTGARLFVLGPPRDRKALRSASQRDLYGISCDTTAARAGAPFAPQLEIPLDAAAQTPFFQQHYWGEADSEYQRDQSWRRIDGVWLDCAIDLALQLDNATNNTSLVLAIELGAGDVLLFAADAQVGNWLSWQQVSWQAQGQTVTAPELLSRTTLYKTGHHGSHNATLRENGLETMRNLKLALIPVDQAMAAKKRWGKMPLNQLEFRLNQITGDRVLRSDKPVPEALTGVVRSTELYHEVLL